MLGDGPDCPWAAALVGVWTVADSKTNENVPYVPVDQQILVLLPETETAAEVATKPGHNPRPDDQAPGLVLTCRRRIGPPLFLHLLTGDTALPMPLLTHHCEQMTSMLA